jgi:hypothetical protein
MPFLAEPSFALSSSFLPVSSSQGPPGTVVLVVDEVEVTDVTVVEPMVVDVLASVLLVEVLVLTSVVETTVVTVTLVVVLRNVVDVVTMVVVVVWPSTPMRYRLPPVPLSQPSPRALSIPRPLTLETPAGSGMSWISSPVGMSTRMKVSSLLTRYRAPSIETARSP